MMKRLICIFLLCLPLFCFAEDFVAGKDYVVLTTATQAKEKLKVIEFFSYNCPWCAQIEPSVTSWVQKQGKAIEFSRIPVVFHKDWELSAKAYYTANLLGIESKLSPLLFKAIQNKNNTLTTNDAMINFFVKEGVEPSTARSAFENSTMVSLKIKEGMSLMAHYQIAGVPAFIINDQFKTDVQMAGSEERLIKILDYLVAKAK